MFSHFEPSLMKFLRDLQVNNDRDWFNDHKQQYEDYVPNHFKNLYVKPYGSGFEGEAGVLGFALPPVVLFARPSSLAFSALRRLASLGSAIKGR
jgi:hypothetical protein